MRLTRRQVMQQGAATAGYALASSKMFRIAPFFEGGSLRAPRYEGVPNAIASLADADTVRQLALRAVDAAESAGADYADVRLTRTLQGAEGGAVKELLHVGVRSFVAGYWGFASSGHWRPDEMTVLGGRATRIAKSNRLGSPRSATLAPAPVSSGTWSTPIEIDPFTVPIEEIRDWLAATADFMNASRYNFWDALGGSWRTALGYYRQERAVATSEGAYVAQTIYETQASVSNQNYALDLYPPQGVGYEILRDSRWQTQVEPLIAKIEEELKHPVGVKSADIGRYDIVCTADVMANLMNETLGRATELDRVLGWEANATGTSPLGSDPLSMLGSLEVASPLVTVTANRSAPRQLATVKWDDECVEPEDTTLIQRGVLTDFQTTRELASAIAPYYEKSGRPLRSHGYAGAPNALCPTMLARPNLALEPGTTDTTLDDLVRGVKSGILVSWGRPEMDFQGRHATFRANLQTREIVNGRLGAMLRLPGDGVMMFDALELWKNVIALGGAASAALHPADYNGDPLHHMAEKGEPPQSTHYSIRAVPAAIKNVAFIDPSRRV